MYIFNIYSDCCKTILVKIEGMAIPFTFKLAGVKNENPTWKTNIGVDIYYENGKWIIGYENEKDFISNSSDECPESVESWSNQINRFKLGLITLELILQYVSHFVHLAILYL